MTAINRSEDLAQENAKAGPKAAAKSQRASKVWQGASTHVLLLVGSIFFIAPLMFMVSTSLKAMRQITRFPPEWIPNPVIWGNWPGVFTYAPMHLYFINTMIIVVPTIIGATFISSLTGYAFARLRAPGRNFMFTLVLATLMLPSVVTLVPTYVLFAKLGWVGTFLPLIIPPWLAAHFISSCCASSS